VPHSMPSSCPSWRKFPTFGGAATPDRSNSVVCAWKTALGESLGVGVGVGVGVCDVLKEDRILSKSRCGISGLLAVSVIVILSVYHYIGTALRACRVSCQCIICSIKDQLSLCWHSIIMFISYQYIIGSIS
jgi:hypothetical protein